MIIPGELRGLDEAVDEAFLRYAATPPATRVVGVDTDDPAGALAALYALCRLDHIPLLGAGMDADLTRELRPPGGPASFAVLTSGSTGRPRAVVRTLASWRDSFPAFSDVTGVGGDDVVLVPGPLSSSLFLFAAVHAVASGARPVLARAWDPATAVDALAHATAVHLTPTMLAELLHRDPRRLGGKTVVCAGARLTRSVADAAYGQGASVTHYYGAAELSFVAAGTHCDDLRPFPGVDVDVRGDGEIWVRSGYLASGCLGAAGSLRTEDGWATVGDRGRLLPDGRLRVEGRGDQAVVTGGVSVPAEDVEVALGTVLEHAASTVIGLEHPRLGEVVTAVIEANGGGLPPCARLRRETAGLLRPAYRPRRWLVVDRVPRTAGGKIARATLRSGIRDGTIAVRPLR